MRRHQRSLDDVTAERLLQGRVGADDAPPGYGTVAELLAACRARPSDPPADAALVAAMVEAIDAGPTSNSPVAPRRKPVLSQLLSAKAAAAFAAVALSATGAAAATGTLPDAAQDGVAEAASHIGIHLPSSADDHARQAKDNGKADEDHGKAGEDHGASTDNHGAVVSETARTTEATGRDKGEAVSTVARAGHGPEAGDHPAPPGLPAGPPEHRSAPVDTPNGGGTGTAGDVSHDGASTNGTGRAAPQASAGSANAGEHPSPGNLPTGRP